MALLPAGTLTNVYASLDVYLQNQLVVAAGLAVRLHAGRRFVPPVDDPWVECHYDFLGLQNAFRRQIGRGVLATERQGYVQLNVYQRARVFRTRYTTVQARDAVVAAFPEGGLIAVYDVTDALPDTDLDRVGVVIIDGTQEHVLDVGLKSGITQRVVQIATRYLEHFTRA